MRWIPRTVKLLMLLRARKAVKPMPLDEYLDKSLEGVDSYINKR